jgi:ubiquinone/menaquinone biosynthesis C-methylase UbiE
MQEAYDQVAAEYAAQYGATSPTVVDWGARFLGLVRPHGRILDVGCGPGQYMAWLEAQDGDREVVGIDLSAGMLAQAKTRVRGGLAQMDMRHLAFPDGSFDGIWCVASLLHLPKADAPLALREMRRVLVPGGALLLIIHEGTEEEWEKYHHYFGTVPRFFARYTQPEGEAMLTSAGFTVVDKGRNESPLRIWLQFLATKPSS